MPFWRHRPREIVWAYDWATRHDAAAARIAARGQAFVRDTLSSQGLECYWLLLLQQYSGLLKYKPGQGARRIPAPVPAAAVAANATTAAAGVVAAAGQGGRRRSSRSRRLMQGGGVEGVREEAHSRGGGSVEAESARRQPARRRLQQAQQGSVPGSGGAGDAGAFYIPVDEWLALQEGAHGWRPGLAASLGAELELLPLLPMRAMVVRAGQELAAAANATALRQP